MSRWTVEVDEDLLTELDQWSEKQQLELLAIQQRLNRGGPDALGLNQAELEGVPPWGSLASQISLQIPVGLPSGWRLLTVEVQPNFRIVIVSLE